MVVLVLVVVVVVVVVEVVVVVSSHRWHVRSHDCISTSHSPSANTLEQKSTGSVCLSIASSHAWTVLVVVDVAASVVVVVVSPPLGLLGASAFFAFWNGFTAGNTDNASPSKTIILHVQKSA